MWTKKAAARGDMAGSLVSEGEGWPGPTSGSVENRWIAAKWKGDAAPVIAKAASWAIAYPAPTEPAL